SGFINEQQYWIGSLQFISDLLNQLIPHTLKQYEAEGSIIALSDGHTWLTAFVLADTLRPEALALIRELHQSGFNLHLVSGDQLHPVNDIASQLNISNIRAHATPEAKVAYIQSLQGSGKTVLMIGDGVNDAPVLALANVSIAMGAGVDIAHAAGDMILLNNNLACLPAAFKLAKKTQRIIKQNLLWALLYNIAALPLAAAGFVTPWLASIGMAMSSLLVVLNALRLIPNSSKKST
ncbi:MAG: HAD-IC family P-type ATPase, partial [Deefgea sp.]